MTDWSGGYVWDIEYQPGFYREQAPALLDLVCLLRGIEPPSHAAGRFRYCELGCGTGLGINLLAAANPASEFVAVDFNPAHIARARSLADGAGLENVRFVESSFEDLAAEADDEPFDYVTLHGVWSWIAPAARAAITDFLRRRLRPGGLVYVSYNALPGWSSGIVVQRLLKEVAALVSERSDSSIRRAVEFLRRVREAGAPYLRDNEVAETVEKLAGRGAFSYLAHEHLAANWQPFYHADVARDLAAAKLTYVGSSTLPENYPQLNLTAEQRSLCDEVTVPEVRETLKDYFLNRSFRKDVFVRGARRLTPTKQDALLRGCRLALTTPRPHASLRLDVQLGRADLEPHVYEPMLDALAERPHTVGELLELPVLRGRSRVQPAEVAGLLTATGAAAPVPLPSVPEAGEPARRLNRALAADAATHELNQQMGIAAPLLGSALRGATLELIVYGNFVRGETSAERLAETVWQPIADRGEKLFKDGKEIDSNAEAVALLQERVQMILDHMVPMWQQLGAI